MHDRLKTNLENVEARIAEAARQSGRARNEIRLVAVTKYVDALTAALLVDLGCLDLGESRPQVLWEKAAAIPNPDVRWHLVGPLQRNKIRRTLPIAALIHSIDSFHLAESIDRIAKELHRSIDVLLEVNVSSEATKQGLLAGQVERELQALAQLSSVRVCGLMCLSGLASDRSQKHREFAGLRELRDRVRQVAPQGRQLQELSMGMSDDFELAIAEGATIVRLGSILFADSHPLA